MSLEPRTLLCGCKINLWLRVGRRLANGYHVIDSLFLPLANPFDRIELQAARGKSHVRFTCLDGTAPSGIDPVHNTICRTLAWYAEKTGFAPALDIRVHKGIPQGSGLGGGSSDAATLLLWLQGEAERTGQRPLAPETLLRESAAIGADVPFFLLNRPALAGGVGEKLTPCPNPAAGLYAVLVCPALSVPTAWAFAELDRRREGCAPPLQDSNGFTASPYIPPPEDWRNDFEKPVFAAHPELDGIHAALLASGALTARMSGTGSTLFGLYRDKKIAAQAAKTLASPSASVYMQRLPANEAGAGV